MVSTKRLFQQPLKSLFLVRYKDRNNDFKDKITRLMVPNGTAILPIDQSIKTTRDVTDSAKILFGNKFYEKSLFRVFYPKRVIFQPTLYPKSRSIVRTSDDMMRKTIKAELPYFKGIAKSKILDKRNVLLDYSVLINKAIITEPVYMKRPSVMAYVRDIYPELLSYIMFNSVNDKTIQEVPDVTDESEEELKVRYYNSLPPETDVEDEAMSNEEFDLKLLSKTRTFTTAGPGSGLEKYGFNSFVVMWKFGSTYDRIGKRDMITGKLKPRMNELKDPNIIYDLSMIQFVYQLYEHFYNGTKSDNQFINEFLTRRVVFYFYVASGVGFVFDCHEIKNILKWTPRRVLSRLVQYINLFIRCNKNQIPDEEIDEIINQNEEEDLEMGMGGSTNVEEVDKNKLNLNIKSILSQYASFKAFKEFINKKNEQEIAFAKHLIKVNAQTPTTKMAADDGPIEKFNVNRIINQFNVSEREDDDISVDDMEVDDGEEIADENVENVNYEDVVTDSDNEIEEENNEIVEEEQEESSVIDDRFISSELILTKKQERIVKQAQEKFDKIKINDSISVKELMSKEVPEIKDDYNHYKKNIKMRNKGILAGSKIRDFTKSYIDNKMDYDIINAVKSLEYNGAEIHFFITNIVVNDTSDQFNRKKTYRFSLTDTTGKKHELVFDVPIPDENGFLLMNGNKIILKKQNFPLPIVKIAPDTVMFTTHHHYKVFVDRYGSGFNKSSILVKKILQDLCVNKTEKGINVELGTVSKTDYITNFEYDDLGEYIYKIHIKNKNNNIKIFFNQKELRKEMAGLDLSMESVGTKIDNVNILPFGIDYGRSKILTIDMSKNESLSKRILELLVDNSSNSENLISTINSFKPPKQRMYSRFKVMSRNLPLIILLGSLYGISKVLKTANINYVFSDKPSRELSKDRIAIRFADGYLYYDQYPIENALLMNGLAFLNTTKYNFGDLDKTEIYSEYYTKKFGSRSVYRDFFSTEQYFLDPVTIKILSMKGLPHTFLESFLYVNMLLANNDYTKESNVSCFRVRSFEIFAEQLYQELIKNRIEYQRKRGKKNSLSVPRDFLMVRLKKTTLLQNFDDPSPIMEAKACSVVSLKGPGGTNLEQAFKIDKRSFGEDSAGIYSIANTDSGTVGTIKELSMNTNVSSLLGFYKPYDKDDIDKLDTANVASIEEAVVPFSSFVDDPKRVIFLAAQAAHIIPTNNDLPIVRTGAEKIVQNSIGDNFCFKAKKDGVITSVDEVNNKIYITYNDKTKDIVDLNPKLNRISNFYLENTLKPVVKTGQKVVAEQPIAANENFFKVDNGLINFTQGRLARVAVMEMYGNDEDGSIISQSFSERMSTNIVKRKSVSLKASTSTVFDIKKVGDHVSTMDYLISFEESGAINSLGGLLDGVDDETLASLRNSPKAGYTGKIVDIRMYWTIPPEQMSKSCKSLVNNYINKIKNSCNMDEKFTGKQSNDRYKTELTVAHNDMVNGCRVEPEGSIVIEFFIQHESFLSTGDKLSMYSACKTTITEVVHDDETPYTESGDKIDMIFSGMGIFRRMVNSVWFSGLIGNVFDKFGRELANEFFEKIKK